MNKNKWIEKRVNELYEEKMQELIAGYEEGIPVKLESIEDEKWKDFYDNILPEKLTDFSISELKKIRESDESINDEMASIILNDIYVGDERERLVDDFKESLEPFISDEKDRLQDGLNDYIDTVKSELRELVSEFRNMALEEYDNHIISNPVRTKST